MSYTPKNPNGAATSANSSPVVIASDQSTIPVSVSGVATAANQTTIIGHVDGIETLIGTTNTTLTTIDGRVDGLEASNSAIQTAVELLDDTVATLGTTTYTEATNKAVTIGAVRRDANTTLVSATNEIAPLQVNATGELKVAQIAALPTGANVIGGVTMAANATTSPAKARDVAAGANDTGIPNFFVRRDAPTAVTPAAGDYEIPQISNLGGQYVHPVAHTAGGATPYKLVSAATTNATSVKASAGQVYSIVATNSNAAVRYLKLYNLSTSPTVGTSTPVQVYMLPAGGGVSITLPVGMIFTTGIAFALTTGAADSDTGAVALSEILVNLTYL